MTSLDLTCSFDNQSVVNLVDVALQLILSPKNIDQSVTWPSDQAVRIRSPAVQINSTSCLRLQYFAMFNFFVRLGFYNGSYYERLLDRTLVGNMVWTQLEVTVPYLEKVEHNQYVIILESSTNQTRFITAIRNISLSVNNCRPMPNYIDLIGRFTQYDITIKCIINFLIPW